MLKIKPPDYKYCPFCGGLLKHKKEEGKSRKYCSKDNWTYYPKVDLSAGALILNDNKVLMVQRAREPYKGTWMFPAGFLDFGEHPENTVKREIEEETGLKVQNLEFIEINQVFDDPREPAHFIFFYKGESQGKTANKDVKENTSVKWVDIKNPPKIGWKRHKEIMRKLQLGEI